LKNSDCRLVPATCLLQGASEFLAILRR